MSKYRESPAPNGLATSGNIIQFCEGWQRLAGEILIIMSKGENPAEATTPLEGGRTMLGALRILTYHSCNVTIYRYMWFDPGPMNEFLEVVELWSQGDHSKELFARAETCMRLSQIQLGKALWTAWKENEEAKPKQATIVIPNAERDRFCYEQKAKGVTLKFIKDAVNSNPEWDKLGSTQG